MAQNTDLRLQKQVIYSIYVRNHTPEGTFRAVIPDLDRIKALGVDIVFVQQRNLTNGNQKIHEIADFLDRNLEMFRYSDGGEDSALIAAWDRRWSIEDEELHYQFHIRERILMEETVNLMQDMEENNVGIKEDS